MKIILTIKLMIGSLIVMLVATMHQSCVPTRHCYAPAFPNEPDSVKETTEKISSRKELRQFKQRMTEDEAVYGEDDEPDPWQEDEYDRDRW